MKTKNKKSMQPGVCALLSVSMLFGAGASMAHASQDEAPALKVARRLAVPAAVSVAVAPVAMPMSAPFVAASPPPFQMRKVVASASAMGLSADAGERLRAYLDENVRKALELSAEAREAQANWKAAEYDIDQAKGQRWPQVQVGVSSPSATFGGGGNNSGTRSAAGNLAITTPVYDWGRLSATIDSRTETSKAAYQAAQQVRQKIAYDTVSALLEQRRHQAALEASQGYVKRMEELVDMLSQIVQSDRGRASELTQARARRLQAVTGRDAIVAKLREVQVNLVKLVGEEVQWPADLAWEIRPVALQDALIAGAEHPAMQQARAEAKAAGLYAESVKAGRLPQLNWVVGKSTQEDSAGNKQPWSTGLSLQWNAFQGGSGRASERAAFERAAAGEEKAEASARDLAYRLRTSAEQRDAAASRAGEYTELIQETDRVRKIFYEQWYHLGKRTLLDVLTAESDHYNNQSAQVTTRFDAEAADLRMRADSAMLLDWLRGAKVL
ncbi:adhesin transport system outer membrane protein [Variovorax boronicumulans]|uniref:TolC family protein n=1 Tax=Variovorax boronicumulans TaxID=436515 RepID=UPI002785E4F7|nr:TolC family protein [Variovorax boronicumulans]MDP9914001.1 adhesin transport system outer membrane protein [Variovorax boronicumulans]